KIANGISDDVPSLFFSFAAGNGNPVCICPAMHEGMMVNPINRRNLKSLEDAGVQIIPPRISEEKAKISENDLIMDHVCRLFGEKSLQGKSILIIGGRGEEMIDPVRAISNLGSGFTMSWFAVNAFRLGASSIVMIGNTEFRIPEYAEYIHASKMEEFEAEVESILSNRKFDVVINCASLSDFAVKDRSGSKIPGNRGTTITLVPREKLLDRIRNKHSGKLVAFKLDDELPPDQVYAKVSSSRPDLVVFNRIFHGSGPFGKVSNHYTAIRPHDHEDLGVLTKAQMTLKVLSMLYRESREES
ncbi:MAG: phosphopantothenoylcysteine decarboxylase, partial [Thermoplasmataceae archaeon]